MPYSSTILAQSGAALSTEMKGLLDAALTASGKYTRVTTAYVSGTKTFDVWKNDGTTDGYEWYLIVATDTANTGRLFTGGCLEYDPSTQIAKKALRGTNGAGFVDAAGYPLVSAGGAEMTFALGNFAYSIVTTVGALSAIMGVPSTAASGNTFKCLVTGQFAWIWWGTASSGTHCQAVGTYQTLHGQNWDLKPLAYYAHPSNGYGGTVWQHPSVTNAAARVTTDGSIAGGLNLAPLVWSQPIGRVGAGGADLGYGSNFVGSRMHLIREAAAGSANFGGGANFSTLGWSVGLAPADLLIFGRLPATAIADTISVGGKTYTSVSAPGANVGLFVNTNPVV